MVWAAGPTYQDQAVPIVHVDLSTNRRSSSARRCGKENGKENGECQLPEDVRGAKQAISNWKAPSRGATDLFVRRSQAWQAQRDMKLEALREQREKRDFNFKPRLISPRDVCRVYGTQEASRPAGELAGCGTGDSDRILRVSIIRAVGLRHWNPCGDSPYCVCDAIPDGNASYDPDSCSMWQTAVASGTGDPVWDEAHEMSGWQAGQSLEFTILDKSFAGPRGKARISSDVFDPNGFEGELPISGSAGAKLQVQIKMIGGTPEVLPSEDVKIRRNRWRANIELKVTNSLPHGRSESRSSTQPGLRTGREPSIAERSEAWLRQREQKRALLREKAESCSFTPRLHRPEGPHWLAGPAGDLYERGMRSRAEHVRRQQQREEELLAEDMRSCPFVPDISRSCPSKAQPDRLASSEPSMRSNARGPVTREQAAAFYERQLAWRDSCRETRDLCVEAQIAQAFLDESLATIPSPARSTASSCGGCRSAGSRADAPSIVVPKLQFPCQRPLSAAPRERSRTSSARSSPSTPSRTPLSRGSDRSRSAPSTPRGNWRQSTISKQFNHCNHERPRRTRWSAARQAHLRPGFPAATQDGAPVGSGNFSFATPGPLDQTADFGWLCRQPGAGLPGTTRRRSASSSFRSSVARSAS